MKKNPIPDDIAITPEILRQLQAICLENLTEIDRICRQNGIKYSIDGGTLLGAVRHGGFIPWDDDADVIMERAEYEKFFAACKTQLDNENFFLQERRTDKHYLVGYPRMRRNHTTYIRRGQERFKHHHGVFVDIFVLDKVPDGKISRYIQRELRFYFRKILWSRTGRLVDEKKSARIGYTVLSLIPAAVAFGGFNLLRKACGRKDTKLICHYALSYPNAKTYPESEFGIPRDLLDRYTDIAFEGHSFMAVADHDRYLRLLYNNYMQLPPEDKRKPHIHLSFFQGVNET
jgi:lipopolysaccharide cholinephosphotransferase